MRLDERRAISPDAFPWSDAGNAERLLAEHGDDLRFVFPWGAWLVYDGRRWKTDERGEVLGRAKATVRRMLRNAVDGDDRRFLTFALASEKDSRIKAMVSLAQPDRALLPADLDADPWTLNTLAGSLDLRDGSLRPHRREDLLTKLAPVEYDSTAECPRWLAFLDRIFDGDADLVALVARLVGASITGIPGVQRLPICWGKGANGKSTFLSVLQRLLGDYAHQAPPELLLHRDRSRGGATPDLADLHGKRFVAAIETGEGRRLDEPLVKQLTGGDLITARRLYSAPFTFQPSHTIWLCTNHLPELRGSDLAIQRRLALVPFTVTIPPGEQREQSELIAELLEEGPGILGWMVDGCLAFQRDGIGEARAATSATSAYLTAQDTLGTFLADKCVVNANARAKSGELWETWKAWCAETGEHAGTQKRFTLQLGEQGFRPHRDNAGRWWFGVGIRYDGEEPA